MNCPKCKVGETKVIWTRRAPGQTRIRERGCKRCGFRFNTTEAADVEPEPEPIRPPAKSMARPRAVAV